MSIDDEALNDAAQQLIALDAALQNFTHPKREIFALHDRHGDLDAKIDPNEKPHSDLRISSVRWALAISIGNPGVMELASIIEKSVSREVV